MNPEVAHKSQTRALAVVLSALLAACSAAPKNRSPDPQAAVASSKPCKTTRNMQSPGPQPVSRPPRCAGSFDAGKLPATAIAPIIIGH
ncbi:MAG: hypothetical protein JWQ90_3433 [Hydrocarboniphaga sp.]|uniref:hypothetical protein n=1 Tax=Hydrocarboniphaga sp. TaxID=2033016 RepID=UPI0026083BD4|nr:hypothetical protein [Hydrocarboniphaga sp.]MDB5970983.1 hypothetical protein [Hydrocarboniphaga sp.]